MSHAAEAQEAFDSAWRDLCVHSNDRCHKMWIGGATGRMALGGVDADIISPAASLHDVPVPSDLVVNPFCR